MKKRSAVRNSKDIIDEVVETGTDIAGHIYEVPASVFSEGLTTALDLKDAVKKQVGLNPAKQKGQPVYVYRWNNGKWRYFMTLRPEREAEWARYVRLSQQQPNRYRIVRSKMNGNGRERRNPQEGADEMYEAFHGREPGQEVVIEKEFHEHTHLSGLGDLVEVWIETPTGLLVQIAFPERDRPILSSNENGTQLFIEGGNQSVALDKFEMNGPDWIKERMVLGRFAEPSATLEAMQKGQLERGSKYNPWNISYLTEKDFDKFESIIYQHDLGEPDEGEPKSARREPPYLEYEPRNVQLYVTGGQYRIRKPMFETSPGIEN